MVAMKVMKAEKGKTSSTAKTSTAEGGKSKAGLNKSLRDWQAAQGFLEKDDRWLNDGYELAAALGKAKSKSSKSEAKAKTDKTDLAELEKEQKKWRKSMPGMSRGKAMRCQKKLQQRRKAEQKKLDDDITHQLHKMPSSRKTRKDNKADSETDWDSSSGFESSDE